MEQPQADATNIVSETSVHHAALDDLDTEQQIFTRQAIELQAAEPVMDLQSRTGVDAFELEAGEVKAPFSIMMEPFTDTELAFFQPSSFQAGLDRGSPIPQHSRNYHRRNGQPLGVICNGGPSRNVPRHSHTASRFGDLSSVGLEPGFSNKAWLQEADDRDFSTGETRTRAFQRGLAGRSRHSFTFNKCNAC